MKKPNDIDVNKLKDQVKQLQEEVYYPQMQKMGKIIKNRTSFWKHSPIKKKQS